MMEKQELVYLKIKRKEETFLSEKEKEFQLKLEQAKKNQERWAIRAIITAKQARISKERQLSTKTLNELTDALYQQSSNSLPNFLKGALEGEAADAAKNSLTKIKKATLITPVKRG